MKSRSPTPPLFFGHCGVQYRAGIMKPIMAIVLAVAHWPVQGQDRRAQNAYQQGLAYRLAGAHERAIHWFGIAIQAAPQWAKPRLARADSLLAINQPTVKVQQELAGLATLDVSEPDDLYAQARLLVAVGESSAAAKACDKAALLARGQPAERQQCATAHTKIRNWEAVVRDYEEVLSQNPDNQEAQRLLAEARQALGPDPSVADTHYQKAVALRREGRNREALTEANLAISLGDKRPEVWTLAGNCELYLGTLDRAILNFGKALELNPALVEPRVARALALSRNGTPSAALEDIEQAISRGGGSNPASAYALRGVLRSKLGSPGAMEDLDKAISLEPNHFEALTERAKLLLSLGKAQEAQRDLSAANRIRPDDTSVIDLLDQAGRASQPVPDGIGVQPAGIPRGATRQSEIPLAAARSEAARLSRMAQDLIDKERFLESLPMLDKAIELNAANKILHNQKGYALLRLGRFREAKESAEAALQIDPGYEMAQRTLIAARAGMARNR